MRKSKLLLTVFAGATFAIVLSGCKPKPKPDTFTYRTYSSALASNWNPHSWETNADDGVLSYLSEGFVSLAPLDTEKGLYQWVYDLAESITDVTRTSAAALGKYVFDGEEEANAYLDSLDEDNPGQYVYQIKLRENLKWHDGTVINADSFIESGKRLLDPDMINYRANLYYDGNSAIAGAKNYVFQGSKAFFDNLASGDHKIKGDDDLKLEDGVFVQKENGLGIFIALNHSLQYLNGYTLKDYVDAYGAEAFDMPSWEAVVAKVETEGDDAFKLKLTEENLNLFKAFLDNSEPWGESGDYWINYAYVEEEFPEATFDEVGLYKVDDLTFNYVMATPLVESEALVSFTSSWLVHEELYDANIDRTGELVVTKYGTNLKNTASYGPYVLKTLEANKQMVFERNEHWHGYEKVDGRLTSTTLFEVNGQKVPQYAPDKIVIDVLSDAAAKAQFLAGNLTTYSPTASELSDYTLSDALYQVDETYTMSFFFNAKLENLQQMDQNEGNINSVVLSHKSFRKGMSLGIDRAEFVTKTAAYKPAYSLFNSLYYYDVWNNPDSRYRDSEPAMQAIVDLYGVEYGEGKPYATLKEAYDSINGYNLSEAKRLMKEAHDALVADGIYTSGEEIKIRIAYAKGPIQSDELAQVALLNKYINAAIEGSGFGKVTFEAIGNLEDRYGDVPDGKFAIGYGAWGGAAFYPFSNMEVYANPDKYGVNEIGMWDPRTETLTVEFDDFEDTMTWQQWSGALSGSGKYVNAPNELKLKILAFLEREYLDKFFRIPLATSTASFLLGFQVSYITNEYNIMYGFGGLRLLKFNYSDAAWAAFVKQNGGQIDYK